MGMWSVVVFVSVFVITEFIIVIYLSNITKILFWIQNNNNFICVDSMYNLFIK